MMGLKILLLGVLMLAAVSETVAGGRGGRGRGGGGGRRPGGGGGGNRPTCEWCFTSSACFQGSAIEGVEENCTNCIADQCVGRSDWLECFGEEWQGEACASANCPTWEFDDRVEECEDCLEDCRYFQRRVTSQSCSTNGNDACATCMGGTGCFDEDELEEIFSSFCLDYIYIKCKDDDFNADCVLEAIQNSCSECNANASTIDRLTTCKECLKDCNDENDCRQRCRNDYPDTLDCPYCTLFCDENDDSPSELCEDGGQCDTACDTCSTCLEDCDAATSQEFDFSDDCTCVEKKSILSFFRAVKKRKRAGLFNRWP